LSKKLNLLEFFSAERMPAGNYYNVSQNSVTLVGFGVAVMSSSSSFRRGKQKFERTRKLASAPIEAERSACLDLSSLKLKSVPESKGE
jgi:hypothetical protein